MDTVVPDPSEIAWEKWFFIAAAAAPAGIFLHELGHYAAALYYGFPDVMLHYASVSVSFETVEIPSWQRGVKAAAGPLITLGILAACCLAASRRGTKPLYIAPAFAVGARTIGLGLVYLFFRVLYGMEPGEGNFDELNIASHFGLNHDLVVGLNLLLYLSMWTYLIVLMKGSRAKKLGLVALGSGCGIVAYMVAGPFILP